jgi:exonuclease VII small subunit
MSDIFYLSLKLIKNIIMSEDIKLLKQREQELRVILAQIEAIRNRIEVPLGKDTKRLLSVSITEIQTGQLFLKEAIEDYERVPTPRFGN